jgi:hypothetical protein
MAQLLESTQLADHDGVTQMNVGRGRIGAQLYAQRLAGFGRFFELRTQFVFTNDLDSAFAKVR